jgi:hypothetical protein
VLVTAPDDRQWRVRVVFVAAIAAAALFWWVLLPLLLVAVDLVVVLLLLVVAVVGRVLFRRPWTVEATSGTGERVTVQVVGWRAALRRRDEIAGLLGRGQHPRRCRRVTADPLGRTSVPSYA